MTLHLIGRYVSTGACNPVASDTGIVSRQTESDIYSVEIKWDDDATGAIADEIAKYIPDVYITAGVYGFGYPKPIKAYWRIKKNYSFRLSVFDLFVRGTVVLLVTDPTAENRDMSNYYANPPYTQLFDLTDPASIPALLAALQEVVKNYCPTAQLREYVERIIETGFELKAMLLLEKLSNAVSDAQWDKYKQRNKQLCLLL